MSISGVNSADLLAVNAQTTSQSQSAMDGLGEDAFMKLLLAQLQNQDPLKPMEDKDFIAQLAQFNSLNQLTQMNQTMEALISAQNLTQGSALIGKTVSGLADGGGTITGTVSGLHLVGGKVILDVEGQSMSLEMVQSVQGEDRSEENGGQDQSFTNTSSGYQPYTPTS